jgi:hypothetical protein
MDPTMKRLLMQQVATSSLHHHTMRICVHWLRHSNLCYSLPHPAPAPAPAPPSLPPGPPFPLIRLQLQHVIRTAAPRLYKDRHHHRPAARAFSHYRASQVPSPSIISTISVIIITIIFSVTSLLCSGQSGLRYETECCIAAVRLMNSVADPDNPVISRSRKRIIQSSQVTCSFYILL